MRNADGGVQQEVEIDLRNPRNLPQFIIANNRMAKLPQDRDRAVACGEAASGSRFEMRGVRSFEAEHGKIEEQQQFFQITFEIKEVESPFAVMDAGRAPQPTQAHRQ